jgi:hypothetical protein
MLIWPSHRLELTTALRETIRPRRSAYAFFKGDYMAINFLEQLAAEWYEFSGYFVRRNILVGKRAAGGHECELDIVAFHPLKKHLIHIEPSMDADSWSEREKRYKKKFDAGNKYIPSLFIGLDLPKKIDQVALLGFAGKKHPEFVGGGRVVVTQELLPDILRKLKKYYDKNISISEQFIILRTLQLVVTNSFDIISVLQEIET